MEIRDLNFLKERTEETHKRVMDLDFELAVEFANEVKKLAGKNNKLIFMGNGASNTIASHGSLDYMNQTGIKSICLNDPAIITAFANDFGYDMAWERYTKINWEKGDILICISSSGNSPNVVKSAEYVKSQGGNVIAFTGFNIDNKLSKIANKNFWVNSKHYNVVEAIHNLWVAMICDLLIEQFGKQVGFHGLNI